MILHFLICILFEDLEILKYLYTTTIKSTERFLPSILRSKQNKRHRSTLCVAFCTVKKIIEKLNYFCAEMFIFVTRCKGPLASASLLRQECLKTDMAHINGHHCHYFYSTVVVFSLRMKDVIFQPCYNPVILSPFCSLYKYWNEG